MVFIPNNNSPEILETGEKSLDFPSAAIAHQLSPTLSFLLFAAIALWCNHFNTTLTEKPIIKWIAVIRFIANDFIRRFPGKAFIKLSLSQFHFMGRSAFNMTGLLTAPGLFAGKLLAGPIAGIAGGKPGMADTIAEGLSKEHLCVRSIKSRLAPLWDLDPDALWGPWVALMI